MTALDRSASAVSFVVPVRNGAAWIRDAIQAIWLQADEREMEVIAVDDGSTDQSQNILLDLAAHGPLRLVAGDKRGAAAAINKGVREARYPIICQVDQDVVLEAGWMRRLVAELDDPAVAAAQGYYVSDPRSTICARVMGLDLELRYEALGRREPDHVCTGNSVYRAEALHGVGLFDERLGYGYDNDMSYRLQNAGHRLVFCRDARSMHRWRDSFWAYCRQQYGFGYGRLELVAKHPNRVGGDSVSPLSMMLHPIVMGAAVVCAGCAGLAAMTGGPATLLALGAIATVAVLAAERSAAGLRAARRFGDRAALFFPALHLARDLAWVAAIAVWSTRRLAGLESAPSNSMLPRSAVRPIGASPDNNYQRAPPAGERVICIIPAHNEAVNLPAVLAEVRACCPNLDVLVVDDGSSDGTASLLDAIGNPWIGFPERLGIGNAMRAGLRYAVRRGYDTAVRLDGDGQHPPDEIPRMLELLRTGAVDVVLGSRYLRSRPRARGAEMPDRMAGFGPFFVRVAQRILAACLSVLTGRTVTDPTSGFYALGPRALRVLASHHPTGYPEPELHLFLSRNHLSAVEVPVRSRQRFGGHTSLMPTRWTAALARVLLALVVVPLRGAVGGHSSD